MELIVCKAKLLVLFSQGTWGVGQLKTSNRALLVLELLLLLHPGRKSNLLSTALNLSDQGSKPEHMGRYIAHSTALHTVALKQRAQPMASLVNRAK